MNIEATRSPPASPLPSPSSTTKSFATLETARHSFKEGSYRSLPINILATPSPVVSPLTQNFPAEPSGALDCNLNGYRSSSGPPHVDEPRNRKQVLPVRPRDGRAPDPRSASPKREKGGKDWDRVRERERHFKCSGLRILGAPHELQRGTEPRLPGSWL